MYVLLSAVLFRPNSVLPSGMLYCCVAFVNHAIGVGWLMTLLKQAASHEQTHHGYFCIVILIIRRPRDMVRSSPKMLH